MKSILIEKYHNMIDEETSGNSGFYTKDMLRDRFNGALTLIIDSVPLTDEEYEHLALYARWKLQNM